jgi:hypothetical protein
VSVEYLTCVSAGTSVVQDIVALEELSWVTLTLESSGAPFTGGGGGVVGGVTGGGGGGVTVPERVVALMGAERALVLPTKSLAAMVYEYVVLGVRPVFR